MASNSSISLVGLDFDTMKSSLKGYLQSQSVFLDYDFNSSAMSVLLDVLSYNTFHNAFYLNMVASESYLDSAQLMSSVISHAKELNYLPRSSRSAKAIVNVNFQSNTNIVTLPKGASFSALIGSNLYSFITDRESVYFSSNGNFLISNLDIYEGQLVTENFVVNYENPNQRFIVSDPSIDSTSLSIQIIEDNSGTVLTYTQSTTTLDLTDTSKIYFLQGAENGKFEIVFGDNIIGRRPKDGAIVLIGYRTCSGVNGNGAAKFSLDTGFADFISSPTVATVATSLGGDVPESISSIKYYAPRKFQTQERAINTNDYEIILKQNFPEINAVSAYGGENVQPPQFGKVFIAVDISNVDGLPKSKIDEYYNYMKPRSPLSITPVFVVPDDLYYAVDSTVEFDINSTNYTEEQIQSLVVQTIINYDKLYLNDFKSSFRYSKFISQIDNIENASILSNDTDVKIYKKISPIIGTAQNIDVNFGISLNTEGALLGTEYDSDDLVALQSSTFILKGEIVFLADDNNGNIRIVKTVGKRNIVIIPFVGTVNYSTGSIKLISFSIDSYQLGHNTILLYAATANKDFETTNNVILLLEPNQLNITVNPVTNIVQNNS
jgi:hypothetical protein